MENVVENPDNATPTEAVNPQAANAPAAEPEKKQAPHQLPKTTGEKRYNLLKFVVADVFILTATAVLAYIATYGQDRYKGVSNYLKRFQTWFKDDLLTKKIPLSNQGELGKVGAAAIASAMVTMHGGNLFAPIMKILENKKAKIVTYFNKRSGTPEEVEIGEERLKHTPKQTWGDVIAGRFASLALISTAFFSAMMLAGKDKKEHMYEGKKINVYRFDKIEDWMGRKLAGFTKEGAAIEKLPLAERLHNHNATNKTYKFGRILALDFFATAAAILTWNAISAFSAKRRKRLQIPELEIGGPEPEEISPSAQTTHHTDTITPRQSFPAEKRAEASHTAKISVQRAAAEDKALQLQ